VDECKPLDTGLLRVMDNLEAGAYTRPLVSST